MHRKLLPCLMVGVMSAGGAARSEAGEPKLVGIPDIARRSFGLAELDGRLVGGGPDYRSCFTVDGFEFTPAFGASADRTWPLRYALRSIERAEGGDQPAEPGAPALVDGRIHYSRGNGVVERYEAQRDGIEQSFVFASRPPGSGDLRIRGHLTTELSRPTSEPSASGLAFEAAGLGSVTLGSVTAIDANGRRQLGTMHCDGADLVYTVPAEFIDQAAYPLLVDPLFGVTFTVASGFDEQEPDVSYDASTDRFLVVWQRRFSSGDSDIRGQRVLSTGGLFGGLIAIESNANVNALAPRVANMNSSNHFVVVWSESTGLLTGAIKLRTVASSNAAVSAKVDIGASTGFNSGADVTGEQQEIYNKAIVVWNTLNTTTLMLQILACNVTVAANGTPTVQPPIALTSASFNDFEPSISNAPANGVHMVAWTRQPSGGSSDIRGAVVTRDLQLVDSFIFVTLDSVDDQNPAVDGDGHNFLVVYETTPGGTSEHDIRAVVVRAVPPGFYSASSAVLDVDVGVLDAQDPDVVWLSGSVLIGWRTENLLGDYHAIIASFDPLGATACENYFQLSVSDDDQRVRLGAALDDVALVVVEGENAATGDGFIAGQRFLANDGYATDLAGGCGGVAYAHCARLGNGSFALRLTGAHANAAAYLMLGTQVIQVACNNCTLRVTPTLFLPAGNTNSTGELAVAAGLPNTPTLAGLQFAFQWLITNPPAPVCPSLQSALSNGRMITLQP